jgi:hypothetical protein
MVAVLTGRRARLAARPAHHPSAISQGSVDAATEDSALRAR